MFKKGLALIMASAMVTMSLAGCSSSKPAETAAQTAAADTKAAETTAGGTAGDWKPEKPISIVNYVAAGGGMDVATREFAKIASKYTDATFVVENQTGAGGLIAMDAVLDKPADGYTVFAGTISNISKICSSQEDVDKYVWGFEWTDKIMVDPLCVVANKGAYDSLEDLIKEAKEKGDAQIWVGPSTGGIKHIVAMKFWDTFGITPTWVPFESGPLAMTALLGGQGVASVGNPSDTDGRDLETLAIATKEELPAFPGAKTFADCGYPELDDVIMWRGFAMKKGTPPEAVSWFQNICQQVTDDPEWKEFFDSKGIQTCNELTEDFEAQIQSDIEDHEYYLKKFGLID